MDKEQTIVVFRTWKKSRNDGYAGQVVAIFPEELGDMSVHTCDSYMHIGQHGSCDALFIVDSTTLSTEQEYNALKEELEGLGYNLVVKKKITYEHLQTRRKKMKEYING